MGKLTKLPGGKDVSIIRIKILKMYLNHMYAHNVDLVFNYLYFAGSPFGCHLVQ